jgi:hypothetical protein
MDDLFFPQSVDFWYRRSFPVVRDMSIYGLGYAVMKSPTNKGVLYFSFISHVLA